MSTFFITKFIVSIFLDYKSLYSAFFDMTFVVSSTLYRLWGYGWKIDIISHIVIAVSLVLTTCSSCLSHQERLASLCFHIDSSCVDSWSSESSHEIMTWRFVVSIYSHFPTKHSMSLTRLDREDKGVVTRFGTGRGIDGLAAGVDGRDR